MTYDGRPIFLIYRPLDFQGVSAFIQQWNKWIKKTGIADSFYFVGMMYHTKELEQIKELGFDCVTPQHNLRTSLNDSTFIGKLKAYWQSFFGKRGLLYKYDYRDYPNTVWNQLIDSRNDVAPQLIPNWDNTPRAGYRGLLYVNATPEVFGKASEMVMKGVKNKKNKLVFLKSWNEWAEGNYMEPDLKYGKGFIKALRKAIKGNLDAKS